ncbi:26S protease subunit [Theileria orientalis]|uniref:26S protease subunit n=1 Tax=Theileria orientalis TaxID=68886 RepID=A0A976QVB1_THEOR|nr:26S protease subunit [Theileria orientalis]
MFNDLHLKILKLAHDGELPGECVLKGTEMLNELLLRENKGRSSDIINLIYTFNRDIFDDFKDYLEPDYDKIIDSLDSKLKLNPYVSIYDNTRLQPDKKSRRTTKRKLYMENFIDGDSAISNIPLANPVRRFLIRARNEFGYLRPRSLNRKLNRYKKSQDGTRLTNSSTKQSVSDPEPKEVKTLYPYQKKPFLGPFKAVAKIQPEKVQKAEKPEKIEPAQKFERPDKPRVEPAVEKTIDKTGERGVERGLEKAAERPGAKSRNWSSYVVEEKKPSFKSGLEYLNTRIEEGNAKPIPDLDTGRPSVPSYGFLGAKPHVGLPSNTGGLPRYNLGDYGNYRPYQKGNARNEVPNLDPKYLPLVTGDVTPEIINMVLDMKVSECQKVTKDDIVGLEDVKKVIIDKIVNPILMPSLHIGLFKAPKGILLFGPPGTGKTTIAKWIANVSNATFFEISPSSITSKFYGESESITKTLFKVALADSPSLIFIDEVDAILGKRKANDDDSSVRMKNQLLQMMDGINSGSLSLDKGTGEEKVVIVVGATNRPHMLDSAALRRFTKRILIPPPDHKTRMKFIVDILNKRSSTNCCLSEADLERIASATDGWTGCDLLTLCYKAAEYSYDDTIALFGGIENIQSFKDFRGVEMKDIERALQCTRPSTDEGIEFFIEWSAKHGSV